MKKHIFLCLLVVALLFGNIVPICFAETYSSDEESYINSVLSYYISAADIALGNDLQLTQGYPIAGNPNTNLYFLFNGNTLIGRLVVGSDNTGYSSSFALDNNPELNSIILDGNPLAISAMSDRLLVAYTNDEIIPIIGNRNDIISYLQGNQPNLSNPLVAPVFATVNIPNVSMPTIDTSGYTASLNVPYVQNQTLYDGPNQGVGLCWAACVCAIGRYKGGASLTPTGLYNALKNQYGGYPNGTSSWVLKGYRYFNINNIGYYASITWSTLYNRLSSSQPVTFVIKNSQSDVTHAVVCEAFIGGDGYATYRFMDPNTSSDVFVTNYSSSLSLSSFPYNNGSQQYNTVVGLYYVA